MRKLKMNNQKEYERWLENATEDADVAAELKTLDRLTSFFLSNRRVAFCILVNLPCTVKAHFAGIVVFEPCVHVARIQLQVCVKAIIRQFLFSWSSNTRRWISSFVSLSARTASRTEQ